MAYSVEFRGAAMRIIELDGQGWLRDADIGKALGLAEPGKTVRDFYRRNKALVAPEMTTVLELPRTGGAALTRIFSLQGAVLLATLSCSRQAAAFRTWALDMHAAAEAREQMRHSSFFPCTLDGIAAAVQCNFQAIESALLLAFGAKNRLPDDLSASEFEALLGRLESRFSRLRKALF